MSYQENPERFTAAVIASQQAGTLTEELIRLIQVMTRRRIRINDILEDFTQELTLRVLQRLDKIDPNNAQHYIGTILVNIWRQHLRVRKCEQKHLLFTAAELVKSEYGVSGRPGMRMRLFANSGGIFQLKYH